MVLSAAGDYFGGWQIVVKTERPRLMRDIPRDPEAPGSYPCVPSREQSQDWKDWKIGPMTRNTPLVPCRHGGGSIGVLRCIAMHPDKTFQTCHHQLIWLAQSQNYLLGDGLKVIASFTLT